MLFYLTKCLIDVLKVILICYVLVFNFSISPGITDSLIISVYPYIILAIPEIFCKVYQDLKMRAVNNFFSFTLYKC